MENKVVYTSAKWHSLNFKFAYSTSLLMHYYRKYMYTALGTPRTYSMSWDTQCITKVSIPLIFLRIFKYISSWDNTDKMTHWHNEKLSVYSLYNRVNLFSPQNNSKYNSLTGLAEGRICQKFIEEFGHSN